jgi:hypothetical protein
VDLNQTAFYFQQVGGGSGTLTDPLVSPDPAGTPTVYGPGQSNPSATTDLGGVTFAFGAATYTDNALESATGDAMLVLAGDPSQPYYLSVNLDTATPASEDNSYVSWGSFGSPPACPGDFNRSGTTTIDDLLAFLADREDRAAAGLPEDAPRNAPPVFSLRPLLRPAVFVPETKSVRELLVELLAQRVHIAMVADEYGGTSGLITIEDIVEEIFGDIEDEYEEPSNTDAGVTLNPQSRTAEIEARVYIDDANDRLEELGIELPENEDYDTVGGFVVVGMGRIPDAGEIYTHNGLRLTVLEAEPTRVVRVRVEVADERSGDA